MSVFLLRYRGIPAESLRIPTESHLGHSEKGVLNCFYSFYDISIKGHNWTHFIEIYCVPAKKRIENKKAAP